MSKINATYSSGYYIAPDVDFRKLEEAQRQEQRGKRKKAGADSAEGGGDDNVKRQTFAIPFDLICQHCNRRIARGSHVYTNRRATEERYLDSIRVWELEILCRFCQGKYYLRTDPATPKETGGYICAAGCKRVEGDFYSLNKQNQAAREEWEKAKADAELDPLAALEKENEAARLLEERNRQIEEEVEQQAGHDDSDLLQMLRSRPRHHADVKGRLTGGDDDHDEGSDEDDANPLSGGRTDASKAASSTGLPPPPSSSNHNHFDTGKDGEGEGGSDGDGDGDNVGDGEDADERSFRAFEQDMERRWRALEREQRQQRRRQAEAAQATSVVQAEEVGRVLARYGGGGNSSGSSAASLRTTLGTSSDVNGTPAETALLSLPSTHAKGVVGDAVMSAAAVLPQHRNKFLVEDDNEDDDEDEGFATVPQRVRVPAVPAAPSASLLPRGALESVAAAVRPQVTPSRFGGSALLRNLVDSDSDGDA